MSSCMLPPACICQSKSLSLYWMNCLLLRGNFSFPILLMYRMPVWYWCSGIQPCHWNWGRSTENCSKHYETYSNLTGSGESPERGSSAPGWWQRSFKWIINKQRTGSYFWRGGTRGTSWGRWGRWGGGVRGDTWDCSYSDIFSIIAEQMRETVM